MFITGGFDPNFSISIQLLILSGIGCLSVMIITAMFWFCLGDRVFARETVMIDRSGNGRYSRRSAPLGIGTREERFTIGVDALLTRRKFRMQNEVHDVLSKDHPAQYQGFLGYITVVLQAWLDTIIAKCKILMHTKELDALFESHPPQGDSFVLSVESAVQGWLFVFCATSLCAGFEDIERTIELYCNSFFVEEADLIIEST